MATKHKDILSELENKSTLICFNCGMIAESPDQDSHCHECGSYYRTRWVTKERTWLGAISHLTNEGEDDV